MWNALCIYFGARKIQQESVWLISASYLPCVLPHRTSLLLSAKKRHVYVSLSRATRINLSFSSTSTKKGYMILRLCALTKRRRAAENVPSTLFCRARYVSSSLSVSPSFLVPLCSFSYLISPHHPASRSLSLPLTSSVPSFSMTFDISRLCRSFGARSTL